MKIACFSTRPHERDSLDEANARHHFSFSYFSERLTATTAGLAADHPVICVSAQDTLDRETLATLAEGGSFLIALRNHDVDNIDLQTAHRVQMKVTRVPCLPDTLAEHNLALLLALRRKIPLACRQLHNHNFIIDDLVAQEIHGQTVGLIGCGRSGRAFVRLLQAFGCTLLAQDPAPHPDALALGVRYVSLEELLKQSDIISLHCPLTPATRHIVNERTLAGIKTGATLINTRHGALMDTTALIAALKSGKLAALGMDVYEHEADIFGQDFSSRILQDDALARLLSLPNVLLTARQAAFTPRALQHMAETTLQNIAEIRMTGRCQHLVQV